MTTPHDTVFLLDVDNTLLDNDRFIADLQHYLEREFGADSAGRYWAIYETLRSEFGYADYLGALQRYRFDPVFGQGSDRALLQLSTFLIDYPFAERLYPRTLDVINRLNIFGRTVILSDGDMVFQPHKIQRSGLSDAVGGRVLVYVHKEQMLDTVQRLFPARHYVMIDDKLRVLSAMKQHMRQRLTTVFPRQGHYAMDRSNVATYPSADFSIGHIGELMDIDMGALFGLDSTAAHDLPP